ncbi:hypothetical protein SPBR_05183 [Sporothrix brasiliensis 5110]|uniref:Uncharacterized protein n=1 Tax=Sporothrix brasiliensis 5110 TaxID=1398154 RepID=A0A0C2IKE8_9PEZI|nr:uncharacterized protein SPBR_05183 [Sporothrix brasiliensis 5110]KIH87475.1 hypothetical protein SPBR_05183 [Sporothrix brasiliensis 5110]
MDVTEMDVTEVDVTEMAITDTDTTDMDTTDMDINLDTPNETMPLPIDSQNNTSTTQEDRQPFVWPATPALRPNDPYSEIPPIELPEILASVETDTYFIESQISPFDQLRHRPAGYLPPRESPPLPPGALYPIRKLKSSEFVAKLRQCGLQDRASSVDRYDYVSSRPVHQLDGYTRIKPPPWDKLNADVDPAVQREAAQRREAQDKMIVAVADYDARRPVSVTDRKLVDGQPTMGPARQEIRDQLSEREQFFYVLPADVRKKNKDEAKKQSEVEAALRRKRLIKMLEERKAARNQEHQESEMEAEARPLKRRRHSIQ